MFGIPFLIRYIQSSYKSKASALMFSGVM